MSVPCVISYEKIKTNAIINLNKHAISCKIITRMSIVESVGHRMPGRIQEFAHARAKGLEARKVTALVNRLNANPDTLPNHVLLIPDGNRRHAKSHGQTKAEGHEAGAQAIYDAFDALSALQIPNVTGWAISTDNFEGRPDEIPDLERILIKFTEKIVPDLMGRNGRLVHLGRTDRISVDLIHALAEAQHATRKNNGQTIRLAIDYNWTNETQSLLRRYGEVVLQRGEEAPVCNVDFVRKLSEESRLAPDIDLVIRPGGEQRISGFGRLTDQAEFVFLTKLQPEMRPLDYLKAVEEFTKRQRRFGK